MQTKEAKNNHVKPRKKLKIALIVMCGLVLLVLFDVLTPVWGGQVRFYAKWTECGKRPQQEGGAMLRHIDYYEQAPVFTIWRDNHMEYFCTPKEAELAGYSASMDSYSYPNLTRQEYEASRKARRER